ncbi:MAG: DinB family protein [Planctomycetaceae bacterium]|nr:DinB family protein [Planctomycetaceae bacterium]
MSKVIKPAMTLDELLQQYELGPAQLEASVKRVGREQWMRHPIPGTWSIHEVVCHIADFELINAERMKRVLAEDNPTLFNAEPDGYIAALQYDHRNMEEELDLIRLTRSQIARILRQTDVEDFQRTGVHSEAGPLTLETLLERTTRHIPHHLPFIDAKVDALRKS